MLGPVLPMLQQDFGKIAGYARASFSGMVVASRVTAGAIVATFRYAGPAIARNMTADDIDEWDSMSHIRLVLSVEKAFGVKFSSAEIGALKNVGDFIDLIGRKRQG